MIKIPTTTNIADRVSKFTNVASTGSERTLVLEFMNEVYADAVEQSECYDNTATVAYSASDDEVSIATEAPDLIKIVSVYLSGYDGYNVVDLKPMSRAEYSQQRHLVSDADGIPSHYSLYYKAGVPYLALWPEPDTAATVVLEYKALPKTLVESAPAAGQESTPTAFAARLHHKIITNGAIALALEMDQKMDRAEVFWGRYQNAVEQLAATMNESLGSRQMIAHFDDVRRVGTTDQSRDM